MRKALQYGGGIAGDSIESAPGPGDVAQSQVRNHGVEHGIAYPHRRAEKYGRASGDAGDDVLRCADVFAECSPHEKSIDVRMTAAVVFDAVSAPDDFPD